MGDILKSAKFLHGLIITFSAVLLLFAFSPDPRKRFDDAINELKELINWDPKVDRPRSILGNLILVPGPKTSPDPLPDPAFFPGNSQCEETRERIESAQSEVPKKPEVDNPWFILSETPSLSELCRRNKILLAKRSLLDELDGGNICEYSPSSKEASRALHPPRLDWTLGRIRDHFLSLDVHSVCPYRLLWHESLLSDGLFHRPDLGKEHLATRMLESGFDPEKVEKYRKTCAGSMWLMDLQVTPMQNQELPDSLRRRSDNYGFHVHYDDDLYGLFILRLAYEEPGGVAVAELGPRSSSFSRPSLERCHVFTVEFAVRLEPLSKEIIEELRLKALAKRVRHTGFLTETGDLFPALTEVWHLVQGSTPEQARILLKAERDRVRPDISFLGFSIPERLVLFFAPLVMLGLLLHLLVDVRQIRKLQSTALAKECTYSWMPVYDDPVAQNLGHLTITIIPILCLGLVVIRLDSPINWQAVLFAKSLTGIDLILAFLVSREIFLIRRRVS